MHLPKFNILNIIIRKKYKIMKKNTIVITGGAGFIGSALIKHF